MVLISYKRNEWSRQCFITGCKIVWFKGPLTDLYKPLLRKILCAIFSHIRVILWVKTFFWSVTLVMMSSGHAQGHVTYSEEV